MQSVQALFEQRRYYPSHWIAAFAGYAFLTATAGTSNAIAAPRPAPQQEEILTPPVGIPQTAVIGGELLRDETFLDRPGYRTTQAVLRKVQFVSTSGVDAYEPLTPVSSTAIVKACAENLDGACLFDDDGDGTFDRIAHDLASRAYSLPEKVPYEKTMVRVPHSRVVRHIYLAAIQGMQLTLRYQEEAANPEAYEANEVIQVDLPTTLPSIVTVRQFKLEVQRIQGSTLVYAVKPASAAGK